jgi:hypothetical protein
MAIGPLQAQASEVGAVVGGGVIGGLAGSVYAWGATATAASIGSAVSGAAAAVPAAASGAAAAIVATSTPVLAGVAAGAVAGYFVYSLAH